MLLDIIYEYETKMPYYEFKVKGLFIQLWIQLLRENYWSLNSHVETNMHSLMHIKQYLMHNTNRKVSLDEISKMSGISKHYLVRLFRQAFGMSPIQYHQLMRAHAARHRIQFTADPLTIIAENMGFTSIHAFSRFLKPLKARAPLITAQKVNAPVQVIVYIHSAQKSHSRPFEDGAVRLCCPLHTLGLAAGVLI